MKNQLILFLIFLSLQISAQKLVSVDPPAKLKDSVEAIYGKKVVPKWYMDESNNYIAKFVHNNQNVTVLFTEKGKNKEIRTEISSKEIPSKIHKYIAAEFPSDMYYKNKIDRIELVENKDARFYYITLNSTGIKDPIQLWFKTTGDFMNKVVPKEYSDKKAKRSPEDIKNLEEKILKEDFSTDDEVDPTEELEGKKKKKK